MKKKLLDRGVVFPDIDAVYIAPDVNPDHFFEGAVIHPGCRISGAETVIGPHSQIGTESPVTLRNSQIGIKVTVGGGFLDGTTLLAGASAGDGFHSRPGTLLEEKSNVAHTVGLKQTVLMPYVTLGSLINFCDILMAGGSDSKNHSEVGSSYIHFNFTPHQDKATASLVGDVPRGVMMNQTPIFLGGQGGMVGPRRIEYGTVIAAGSILRQDVSESDRLLTGIHGGTFRAREYDTQVYGRVDVIIRNCLIYLGNMLALKAWYTAVRAPFMTQEPWARLCHAGALKRIDEIWTERIKRLDQLEDKLTVSVAIGGRDTTSVVFEAQKKFLAYWKDIKAKLFVLNEKTFAPDADIVAVLDNASKMSPYVDGIKGLRPDTKTRLTAWLQSIVDEVPLLD